MTLQERLRWWALRHIEKPRVDYAHLGDFFLPSDLVEAADIIERQQQEIETLEAIHKVQHGQIDHMHEVWAGQQKEIERLKGLLEKTI